MCLSLNVTSHFRTSVTKVSSFFSEIFLLFSQICTTEVEVLMTRLQTTFKQELSGVGASLEKKWKFCGFDGLKTT